MEEDQEKVQQEKTSTSSVNDSLSKTDKIEESANESQDRTSSSSSEAEEENKNGDQNDVMNRSYMQPEEMEFDTIKEFFDNMK